jgi:hypothetical protein
MSWELGKSEMRTRINCTNSDLISQWLLIYRARFACERPEMAEAGPCGIDDIEKEEMQAKGLLMRVGIDKTFGAYNAPINPATNDFLYMPIPEDRYAFRAGMQTSYSDISPSFREWASINCFEAEFPEQLQHRNCHLDPDFTSLTYGDQGTGRGNRIRQLVKGDFLAFFASFKPIQPWSHTLIYALFGIMVVDKVVKVSDLPEVDLARNAHSRIENSNPAHLVVFAQPQFSGRFEKAIPIGEFRSGAYRVTNEILHAWGGLDVKDGFIQRSVCPPWFTNSTQFMWWLETHRSTLIHNNY